MGSVRRGAIRIGLELIQSLSSKPVAPSVRDDLEGRVLEKLNNPYINREGVPLAMDIFKPIGEEYEGRELPVIVAIHGGGLVTGDRKISLDLSRELALRGYLVFSIEYRLSPRANVCEQFDDICAGMDLVGRKLIEYEVDYSRVFLTADSAGAFLAIYTAAMKKSRKLQDAIGYKPSHMTFKAIGLSCGMFYTSRDDILGALLSEQFYGDKKEDAEFLQFMNPEHPEIINNLPPTFLVTSKGDFLNRYSIMYEKALKKAGKTTKLLYYGDDELKHTFNFAHPDLPQSKDANDKMLAFFEEQAQIQYARQTGRAELAKKTEAIESKIKRGTYKQQRLWKTIREMKSLDEDSLNSIAIRDEARSVTYRQMFRKWDCYAEVFSGLKMTGRSNARVGIPGAMTKEAVYAFYGLNMTGALVSMLPYAYMEDAERLAEAVREEELTDLILTDYQASPSFVKKLMEQETGLRRVIILTTEMRRAAVPQEEITKIKLEQGKIHHILDRRHKGRSSQRSERIRLHEDRFTGPVQDRCHKHPSQNRSLDPLLIQIDDHKQADKHRDNTEHHLSIPGAHLFPAQSGSQCSEEVLHHVVRTSGIGIDPRIRSESDVQKHQTDCRRDSQADRQRNRVNNLFTDVEHRQDQEQDSFNQNNTQCRTEGNQIGGSCNGSDIRDNDREETVQSHTGRHDKRLVRKKGHGERTYRGSNTGRHKNSVPKVRSLCLKIRQKIRVQGDDIFRHQFVVGHAGRRDVQQTCFRITHGNVAPCFNGEVAAFHGDAGFQDQTDDLCVQCVCTHSIYCRSDRRKIQSMPGKGKIM